MFKEEEHPRDEDGKFKDKNSRDNGSKSRVTYRSSYELLQEEILKNNPMNPYIDFEGYLLNPSYPKNSKGEYDIEVENDVLAQVEAWKDIGKKYPNGGTLLICKGKVVKMRTGYQFSFMRPPTEIVFTPEEADEISEWIMRKTGSRLFAGFWGGSGPNDPPDTEPSFWCEDKDTGMEIAKLFNQKSMLDWNYSIEDDAEYIINEDYDESNPKLDKQAILAKIRKEKVK